MDRKQRRRRDLPKEMKEYRRNIQSKITQTHTLKHKHIIETRSAKRVAHSPQGTHTDTDTHRETKRNYILQIPSRRGRGRKGKRKEKKIRKSF